MTEEATINLENISDETLLTTTEAAKLLGIQPGTVSGWIKDGRIEGEKQGQEYRIPFAQIRHIVEERERTRKDLERAGETVNVSKFLTTREVAEILNVRVNTVAGMIRKGRLPAIRVGRDYLIDLKTVRSIEPRHLSGRPRKAD